MNTSPDTARGDARGPDGTAAAGTRPVALVTGATGGIGTALARALDARGFDVVTHGLGDDEAGRALAASLHRATHVDGDVTDPSFATGLAELCSRQFGRLDLLVNNAGIGIPVPHGDLQAVTPEFFEKMLAVNLLGPWHLVRALEPLLRSSRGSVLNMSSVAGSTVSGSSIPYAVSKAALEHLTRCLAVALGPDVRVNAIAPGYVETERTKDWTGVRDQVLSTAPAGRLGLPADVAAAALALHDSPYTTGAVLPVDGGLGLA